MAVVKCVGPGQELDWSAGANWGGSAPASDDEVVFTTPGVYRFTSGLSQGSVNLQSWSVGPGVTIIFPTTMTIDVSNVSTAAFPTLEIAPSASIQGTLSGSFDYISNYGTATQISLTGSSETSVVIQSIGGVINVDSNVVVTRLYAQGDAEITLDSNATELVYATCGSRALVTSSRSSEETIVSDYGRWKFAGAATVADGSAGGVMTLLDHSTAIFATSASAADTIRAIGPCYIDWSQKVGDITIAVLEQSASAIVPMTFPGGTVTATSKIPLGPSNMPPYTGKG
jgi:hypothetical protein